MAVSATSLSNVVGGPLLGILYDRTHASKLLVVTTLGIATIGIYSRAQFTAITSFAH